MISLICPLLYYLLFNGLIVYITKRTFGKCIPLTFIINAFIYFITQVIFHTFKVGFTINILLPIILLGLLYYNYKKGNKKELKEWKQNYFTNGMIAFIVIFIGVFIFDLNRTFTVWDEWSHWGEMIKEMFRLDRLYSIDASTLLVHKDYPPIVQLFEMFYTQISGGYNETYLIRSIHLISFSLFIPSISEKEKKKQIIKTIFNTIMIMISVFLILLFFDQHRIINAIYIDYLMSIIVAYLMSNIIFEKDITSNFNLFIYMISFSFLLLMKQMGLPLYLMILFMYIANLIINNIKNIKDYYSKNKRLLLKIAIMLIIIPLVFWKGWNVYISTLDVNQQFKLSDIKVLELMGIISGQSGKIWQIVTASNYISALKYSNITTSYIHLTYIECFVLTLLLLYLLYLIGKKIYSKNQIQLSAFTISCGYLGYAFVMLVLYVFCFGSYEGPHLASYNRYMSTFVLIGICFIYMLIVYLETTQKNKKISYLIILPCILFLLQSPEMIDYCIPKIHRENPNIYELHSEIVSSKTEETAKIFVIAQNTLGEYNYPIKYYSGARIINTRDFSFTIDEEIEDYEKYFNQEYKEELTKYDYLYLAKVDDDFINHYSFLFNGQEIKNTNLYKITIEDDNLILKNIDD